MINGTGNYYIEAQARDQERMDIIVDYLGERSVVELKIWRGHSYHAAGGKQLAGYLEACHLKKGYLLTYNFNKNKTPGTTIVNLDDKTLFEVFV